MKRLLSDLFLTVALIVLFLMAVMTSRAQVTTNEPVTFGISNAPIGTLVGFAMSILPQLDVNATYFTNASEIEIRVAPLWKTAAAAGTTPYLSAGADYWFKTWVSPNGLTGNSVTATSLGVGAELVTLGNGAGSDTVDSVSGYFEARRSIGNIAGYLMAGLGRDINGNRWEFEFGPGVEIRYKTGLALFLDTRLVDGFEGEHTGHVDWMTRFGVSMHL